MNNNIYLCHPLFIFRFINFASIKESDRPGVNLAGCAITGQPEDTDRRRPGVRPDVEEGGEFRTLPTPSTFLHPPRFTHITLLLGGMVHLLWAELQSSGVGT